MPQVAVTHPHVFVDRGVDFVFEEERKLSALNVTWQYDAFESLYLLSSLGVFPSEEGELTPGDRARLIHHESNWPEHFHGAAHFSVNGLPLTISRPKAMEAEFEDGKLTLRFRRELSQAVAILDAQVDVARSNKRVQLRNRASAMLNQTPETRDVSTRNAQTSYRAWH